MVRWTPRHYQKLFVFIVISFLLIQPVHAKKRDFDGFESYHSEVQVNKLNAPPVVQIQKYEIIPPLTSDCQTAIISPGNGCHVEISSLKNSGIAQISEISGPSSIEATALGIQSWMVFNPHTGRVSLLASTPNAEAGEFKTASAKLHFTYDFKVTNKNRFMRLNDFSVETIGEISGGGADVNIYLMSTTGNPFWQVFESLRFTDKRFLEDQKIDLLNFVRMGDTVRLSVDLNAIAYSATVDIREDPSLAALPSEAAVSFRLTIPKQ